MIPILDLPDKDDRHVLAAAIRASAQHIITENLADFPAEALRPYDIEAVSADQFLASTLDLYPSEGISALRKLRQEYISPAMNASEFLFDLMRVGLARTASLARAQIDLL